MATKRQSDYQLLAEQFGPFRIGNRTDSAALLAWFLESVWRMEPEDVPDSLCDGGGDRGVDAISVDEEASEIVLFQSKHRKKASATQGDKDLRAFIGVADYFSSAEALAKLLESKPRPRKELRALIRRLELIKHLADGNYSVRLVFVTNAPLDDNARSFLTSRGGTRPPLEIWDRDRLAPIAKRTQDPGLVNKSVTLAYRGDLLRQSLASNVHLIVALVPATALVELPGISDFSLFDPNVRLSLGRTRINRELTATIRDLTEHELFPAYHNGLTLLTQEAEVGKDVLVLDGVAVVNGCQSITALFDNAKNLSDDLLVLAKIIELGDDRGLSQKITYRANNQNPINIRDQRSNDRIQRDLQSQVSERYGSRLFYSVKQGEPTPQGVPVLDNRLAAQLIVAIWMKEPWAAVRKVRLFDEKYHTIFTRRIDADRLYLAFLIDRAVAAVRSELKPVLQSSFSSIRFTLAYLLTEVLRLTSQGERLLESPERWLPGKTTEVSAALEEMMRDVVESVNFYVDTKIEESDDELFDPKVEFKSQAGVRSVTRDVVTFARRTARRDSDSLFVLDP